MFTGGLRATAFASRLAGDPDVLAGTGQVFTTPALARHYGFTDVDGSRQSRFWDNHYADSSGPG
jgi:hypothetical protein